MIYNVQLVLLYKYPYQGKITTNIVPLFDLCISVSHSRTAGNILCDLFVLGITMLSSRLAFILLQYQ